MNKYAKQVILKLMYFIYFLSKIKINNLKIIKIFITIINYILRFIKLKK